MSGGWGRGGGDSRLPGVAARGRLSLPRLSYGSPCHPYLRRGRGEGGREGRGGQWQILNVFLLHLGEVDLKLKLVLEKVLVDLNLMLSQT